MITAEGHSADSPTHPTMPLLSVVQSILPSHTYVPTWTDLRQLDAARAQVHWAAVQAYSARFGAWTQLAAFIAAGAAAWFTFSAAEHARTQARAALAELDELKSSQRIDSIVQAWALIAFVGRWINTSRRNVSGTTDVLDAMQLTVRRDPEDPPYQAQRWSEIKEEGVRLAAGVRSGDVLNMWIDLIDAAHAMWTASVGVETQLQQIRRDHEPEKRVHHDARVDDARLEPAFRRQAGAAITAAEEQHAAFWRMYDDFIATLDKIGRDGRILVGRVSGTTGMSGTLS